MNTTLDTLRLRGVAQVLVYLRPAHGTARANQSLSRADQQLIPRKITRATASGDTIIPLVTPHVAALKKYFTHSEFSQDGAIAASNRAASDSRPKSWKMAQEVRYYPNLGILLGNVDHEGLVALNKDVCVMKVEAVPQLMPIYPIRALQAPVASRAKLTWGLRRLRVDKLWKEGLSGKGVLVGHLDTGIDGRHAVFKHGAIERFVEFDRLGVEISQAQAPRDTADHGTHTAATLVGRPVSGRHVGVAYGAALASAIVIEGGNVVARVLAGMDWCVGHKVRVLNMSLGFPGYWPNFLPLTQILRQQNILPVFAVGNDGPGTSRSPGNYAEALSIGAASKDDEVADFSSSQEFRRERDGVVPDLVAPGVDVYSAKPNRGYQSLSGSSMATPHVSGMVALLFEAKPEASVDEVEHAILASCDESGVDSTRGGRGIPDGPRALEILME